MVENIQVNLNNGVLEECEVDRLINYIVGLYEDKIGVIDTYPNVVCTMYNNAYDVKNKSEILDSIKSSLKEGFKKYANNLKEVGFFTVDISGTVKYANGCESVQIEVKCKERVNYCTYLTLCNMVVYKYDRGSLREEFDKFIATKKLNKEQIDYINAYFEEECYSNPGALSIDRFKDNLRYAISTVSVDGLVDYIGLYVDSVSEDLSSDIKEYVCVDDVLKLFRNKVKIEKLDNGYDISIFGCIAKSVRYMVSLVEV